MAAPVTRLRPVKLPAGPSAPTAEQDYWRSFRSQQQIPSPSSFSVTHISVPPLPPATAHPVHNDLFAVTTGVRVQLFSIRTRKLVKTVTRFDDVAHSGEIRRDGRVMVAGDDTGTIQVFDVNSRAILKTWKEHKQPVWTTRFARTDQTTLMSASDDKTVRLWDLPSQESTNTFAGHADYVRSGEFMPGSGSNIVVSGSYDGTVKLWDPRATGGAVMTFKHAAPVESVLPLPSGTTVVASAENQISVLDLVAAKPLRLLKNHQKTVTSLCLASKGSRVVSGGLDGHMKVFETTGWSVVAGSKYPSPILSLAIIGAGLEEGDKHVAVGMQSGLLSIRTRLSGQQKVQERERQKEMQALLEGTIEEYDKKTAKKRGKGWQQRFRGREFRGDGAHVVIEGNKRRKGKKETPWEVHLRGGRYGPALDTLLEAVRKREEGNLAVLTLLTALRHRSATRRALQGRDEITLQPVLHWVTRKITNPKYMPMCVEVGLLIVDLYSADMGQSPAIDGMVGELHEQVRDEVERAQQACQTGGMLSLLMAGEGP
ncbi:MAG: hypothetical protein M1833_005188 [Piccolia ochrophora]|nr:MAG: hypothetical protein M1833_005188 [Piccolia ochrophora]